ncbi:MULTISPECIES: peptidoglycan recognition protein family protein [Paenibacillus]|uniref:peptidoglycan recognition protein family protein n=1 Tax=Paenibacillus TaxID=44249 RepID=UPI0022B87979|nr:peptidoglycan recognition family protein [Paenibacillus caseinilyticus]MCZ8523378.1 peptidoglycan recognition family protein [Paenibacillus caseinilyticus]
MAFLMKYEITPRYLTGPSQRRPKLPLSRCRFMVAHDTGNPSSTASANVAYYERTRNDMASSAHLFVDDKQIIECIPLLTGTAEKAYHVLYNVTTDNARYGSDANDTAGAVEWCYGGSISLAESYRRYVWVFAYACYRYGLNPLTDITAHYVLDPARRSDPQTPLRQLGKSFASFVQDVADELLACTVAVPPQPDVLIPPEDANKLIAFLSAIYYASDAGESRAEVNRLANELRRISGQPEE